MKRRNKVCYLLICITSLFLIGLWGCSSNETDNAKSNISKSQIAKSSHGHKQKDLSNFDLCDKLTFEEIHQFFPNSPITITKHGDEASDALGRRECFYSLSDNDMKFIQISLNRTQDMSPSLQKQGRTVEGNYLLNKKYVENPITIKDLGKEAYYGGSGLKPFAGLNILLDKDTALSVNVGLGRNNDNDQAHIEVEKALAKKIISRL